MSFYIGLMIVIVSTVLYHLFQKATPSDVHPLITLAVTYASATAICVALLPFFPLGGGLRENLRQVNWASIALATAVVGIEVGFLLAYRAGWNISLAALVGNAIVALMLIPIGLLFFSERISAGQLFGIGLCVVGLVLINRR
jgi:drug/metabolite transporter (DMT)-like permease